MINTANQTDGRAARTARRARWRKIVAEFEAGDASAAAFARARGLPLWQLAYWRKALRAPTQAHDDGGFVRLRVTRKARAPAAAVWVEVGGWRVCVGPEFDPATLRRAVEALTPCWD
jgi:type IV secretory pathway VirB9-like protein